MNFLDLPDDVLNIIVTDNNQTWYICIRLCTHFNKFNKQEELKRKFLQARSDPKWSIKYTFPNGTFHNYELPSIMGSDGTSYWYQNGKLHRDSDMPAIITRLGSHHWYYQGNLHRYELPAVIYYNGEKCYFEHGKSKKRIIF